MGFHCQSDAPEGWSKEREAGKATRCVCLSVETVWTAHASWTRDTYFGDEPRPPFRSLEFFFGVEWSVHVGFITTDARFLFMYRSVVNASRLPRSTVHMFPWAWTDSVFGEYREEREQSERLRCVRGEFSPLKMRTEREPLPSCLWLTLTVSRLPVSSLRFVPFLGFPQSRGARGRNYSWTGSP